MTIKSLMINEDNCQVGVNLTSKYNLFIEGLNEDYINIYHLPFNIDNIKNLFIELNDNEGNIAIPIQDYLQDVNLDTNLEDLKDMALNVIIDKSIII